MMGQHSRSEALFYYFRLEDQVPETHLLRLIEKHISLAFVREKLKESYSDTGRPSIDPELLLRILLIGYLYGITSERKLVEELRMHLAWRWFTGLGFDQEIPHHSSRRLWPAAWKPDWCKGTTCISIIIWRYSTHKSRSILFSLLQLIRSQPAVRPELPLRPFPPWRVARRYPHPL